jgi:3',5'-cyclic-AMP phosphodiesterase
MIAFLRKTFASLILVLWFSVANSQTNFSFVYLPDIHLKPDSMALIKFGQIAGKVNDLKPDFVLTGGDMIYTAKNVNDKKATLLFDLMDEQFKTFDMPIYMTMGNHENVGITIESGIDKSNPMWGKRMYEKRYNPRFYSFVYEGWKFFVLDGIKILEKEKNYTQGVDSVQIEWIKNELKNIDKNTPIVISIHTPLVNPVAITNLKYQALTVNAELVLNLYKPYNLKLVLQGHNHTYMNLFTKGIHYISGGSTQYGTNEMDEGLVLVTIKGNNEKVNFIQSEDGELE